MYKIDDALFLLKNINNNAKIEIKGQNNILYKILSFKLKYTLNKVS